MQDNKSLPLGVKPQKERINIPGQDEVQEHCVSLILQVHRTAVSFHDNSTNKPFLISLHPDLQELLLQEHGYSQDLKNNDCIYPPRLEFYNLGEALSDSDSTFNKFSLLIEQVAMLSKLAQIIDGTFNQEKEYIGRNGQYTTMLLE